MTRSVHYLVRKPGETGRLIYPSELDAPETYAGFGSFFLGGPVRRPDDIDEVYSFWAILQTRAIDTKLVRRSPNVFVADIEGIGAFRFRGERVGVPARYAGRFNRPDNRWLLRQLAPFDHNQLDDAVRSHDFYFVGFTPRLGTIAEPLEL